MDCSPAKVSRPIPGNCVSVAGRHALNTLAHPPVPHRIGQPTVSCLIPPDVLRALPVRRLFAAAGVLGPDADPWGPALSDGSDAGVELRCSIDAATALIRQLCALRHTGARYDTALLTACANAVGVLDEALERALSGELELV